MAFTNLYDDTFPADTELANLIGANLRQVRLDVQQRMAAISGLDAAKPNFGADTQPANWNGILFFATDTGKVYQFNNPAWTDVTASLIPQRMILMNGFGSLSSGLTSYFSLVVGVGQTEASAQIGMPVAGTFRTMYVTSFTTQPASGSLVITLRLGGVSQTIQVTIAANAPAGTFFDSAHTVPFVAGNLVNYQLVNNATATSAQVNIALGY